MEALQEIGGSETGRKTFFTHVFDMSQDRTDAKTYYLYRSPMGVAHREFVMM